MRARNICFVVFGFAISGCAHSPPEAALRSYAQALEAGRLDDAWALSTPLERPRFLERYADPATRHRRAAELLRIADGQPGEVVGLESGPKGWRVVEGAMPIAAFSQDQQARATVDRFLAAVQAGDFEAVFASLAATWRTRYTPERLKADFTIDSGTPARLKRIRAALQGRWELTDGDPVLPLGQGRSLKLVREDGTLKVLALE